MNVEIANVRQPGEKRKAYRERLKKVAALIKHYLRGYPATHSRDGREYVVGPRRKHQPQDHNPRGTLVKAPLAA